VPIGAVGRTSFEGWETNSTRSGGGQIFAATVMHSAANKLADFAARDRVNSATETQTPAANVAATRHSSGRLIFRYGMALGSIAAATALGFFAERCNLHESIFTIYLLAVALTSWYAGAWPAVTAFAVGELAFDYFFTPPLYSLSVTREDIAYFPVFTLFSGLLIWFGVVRRQVEGALRQSRDVLKAEVEQRRALNVELAKRSDELQATNKELEAFAYSVSHDLRAPVRHIAGFTELLQKHSDAVLDDKSRHHIRMILDAANRMGSLVDDLLAFSRIGRVEPQKTTIHLEGLVKHVIGEIAPDTQGRKIIWRVGTLPICYGDPSLLRLVFNNLVSNAVKFTRTRPQAEIEIDSLNHTPDEVVVFVKDNGVGFDMKYKDKLFGVFQRLHSQEAFEGTGIGLATVQRIVQGHGGRVWAEASVNTGATFYVVLPKLER
jgi:K+-sensing histidine kinase KdpD